jgi:hypothetical protein
VNYARDEAFGIASAIKHGLRAALRHYPAAVWTYVLVSLGALPVAVALGALVQQRYGDSLDAGAFARALEPLLVTELAIREERALGMIAFMLGGTVFLWAIVSTFLAGATINAVSRAEQTRTGEFFAGGGRVFGRLMRLLPLALPFSLLAVGLPAFLLNKLATSIIRDLASDRGAVLVRWATIAIALVLLAWTSGAYDLMRVEAVARGEHRARYAFWRGLMRAVKRPLSVLALSSSFGVAGVALTLLVSLGDVELSRSGWFAIVIGFLLQQAIAFVRALLRVGLAGAEVAYVMLSMDAGRLSRSGPRG